MIATNQQAGYPYLPAANSEGLPVIPMTDEQKYRFDLKGWLLMPAVLTGDRLEAARDHILRWSRDRESLPEHERFIYGGAAQGLLDHPALVGVLNEILSHQGLASDDCYGFRYDGGHVSVREKGHNNYSPHGGSGLFNFAGSSHFYQHQRGRVFAGLTRIVWELNDVNEGDGGTLLLSGSHKAAFDRPQDIPPDSDLWESYACPAGSFLVFTESLCHSGTTWTCPDRPRISIFTCYNTVNAKWHRDAPPRAVLDAMPTMRRTLFRAPWHGMTQVPAINKYVDEENIASM